MNALICQESHFESAALGSAFSLGGDHRLLRAGALVSSENAPVASLFLCIRPGCQPSSHQPDEAGRATRSALSSLLSASRQNLPGSKLMRV